MGSKQTTAEGSSEADQTRFCAPQLGPLGTIKDNDCCPRGFTCPVLYLRFAGHGRTHQHQTVPDHRRLEQLDTLVQES